MFLNVVILSMSVTHVDLSWVEIFVQLGAWSQSHDFHFKFLVHNI